MNEGALIEAVNDLARVLIAFNFEGSKADAARRLHLAGVKQARIATLLGMATNDVTSLVSKLRKAEKGTRKRDDNAA